MKKVEQMAEAKKCKASQLALAWLLWRSPVMLPIPGTSKVEHLEENVQAATLKIDEGVLRALAAAGK